MILTDVLLIAGLAAFVLAWWIRPLSRRPAILVAAALLALGAGVAGVLDARWQGGLGAAVAAVMLLVLLINRLRKADRRTGVPFVSGPVFTILAGLAVTLVALFPAPTLPSPGGPQPVGVRTFEVVDNSRRGVFAAKPDEGRRLLVRVWYPAGDVAGLKRLPYFTDQESQTTGRTMGELFGFPPLLSYLKHVKTHSWVDAPLAPGAQGLPVVFYSHGYTSFLGQNTALMEHLASHGYVVFSLQHTYDSSATVFPNGDVAPLDPALVAESREAMKGEPPKPQRDAMNGKTLDDRLNGHIWIRENGVAKNQRLARSGVVWLADRLFLHDLLQRGGAPAAIAPVVAASDLTRTGEMGMSFGGAVSGSVCMVDPRCAAGINMDGGDFPFEAFAADMPRPFLMFHSDMANILATTQAKLDTRPDYAFNEFSYESFGSAGALPNVHRMQVIGARHLGISDFTLFMRRPVRDALLGTTPSDVMIGVQNDMVLGFFDHYLRGKANGFPETQRKAYADWLAPASNAAVRAWWTNKTPEEQAAITARIAAAKAGKPVVETR